MESSTLPLPLHDAPLATLNRKKFELIKLYSIMKLARRQFTSQHVSDSVGPEIRSLFFLYSENKRLLEKCVYGELKANKCRRLIEFYTNSSQSLSDIGREIDTKTSNAEAEEYLRTVNDQLIKRLEDNKKDCDAMQQTIAEKVEQIELEAAKAPQNKTSVEEKVAQLNTKLENGMTLDDDEVQSISLGQSLKTNLTLRKAIETLGGRIDALREEYLWRRDQLVSQLASHLKPVGDNPVGLSLSSPEKRSPSCNKGKTMRDFDEELTSLRKENFDLKMRVYVLNEQMELFQSIDNADQLFEVNNNLKNEVDKLRNELADKEDLVLKAGEAMNILSAKHRDEVSLAKMELQEQCSNLEEMNARLQKEVRRLVAQHMTDSLESLSTPQDSELYSMALAATSDRSKQLEADMLRLTEELSEKLEIIDRNEMLINKHDELMKKAMQRQLELEKELSSKSDLLSGTYKTIREKEHQHNQLYKKTSALEDFASLQQLENEKLQKTLAEMPSREVVRDLMDKLHTTTTENNALLSKIEELQIMLDEERTQKIEDLQAECSVCRQNCDLEDLLNQAQTRLQHTEAELEETRDKSAKLAKAFRKANSALTLDVESMKERLKSCVCSGSSIPQKEEFALRIRPIVNDMAQLQLEKKFLIANSEATSNMLQEQLREKERIISVFERQSLANSVGDRVAELESEVLKLKSELETEVAAGAEKTLEMIAELESKKKEIDSLNEELRKRTFNLQELVNKELWDKNREIEKLNKACEKKQCEVMTLKERLGTQEDELRALNDKMQELSDQVNISGSIVELKAKLADEVEKGARREKEAALWKKTAECSEKARKELMNACCLFKARLEELASFLESLLPCLGTKKRKILQDAINRSREASRTLSESVMNETTGGEVTLTGPILPDFSQVDFCSDNDMDLVVPEVVTPGQEVVAASRATTVPKTNEASDKMCWKINNYEDRFDFVKLANMSSSFNIEEVSEVSFAESFSDSAPSRLPSQPKLPAEPLGNGSSNKPPALSESEGWSEPDRNVSLARIGLRDSSLPSGRPSTEESSDNSCKATICKRRCEAAEVRRLSLKVKSLERVIHSLKIEPASRSASKDRSHLDGGDFIAAVDDLKREKDKLEASLKHNKDVLNQLTASYVDEPTNNELLKAVHMITHQFDQIYKFFNEMEEHYFVIEEERETVKVALLEKEKSIEILNKKVAALQAELKEKANEILEKECALLEIRNDYIVLDSKWKTMATSSEEVAKWKAAVAATEKELEVAKDSHSKEINTLKSKLKKAKDERDAKANELQSDLDRAFKRIDDVCLKKVLMEAEFKQKVDLLQKERRLEVEQEVTKRVDVERKLVEAYQAQAELRKRMDEEMSKSKDVETAQKSSERWWRRRTEEAESSSAVREAELRRRLDSATIATSQAVLERTRLANEKIRMQCELRRRDNSAHDVRVNLEQRVLELEETNKELLRSLEALSAPHHLSDIDLPQLFTRQRSNPTSDYTSDPDQHELKGSNGNLHWFPVCGRSNNNCSPDLGIESDQGRLSSLDPPIGSPKTHGEREIVYLRREVARLTKLLEDVHRTSKTSKEKLEGEIYSELSKTQDLLVKTNRNLKIAQI